MSKYRIHMNGKTYEMEIELVNDEQKPIVRNSSIPATSFKSIDPVVQAIAPEAERKILVDEGMVVSPMPGSIIKIFKQVGERVQQGEPLAVLEAMKMENEVTAPRNGLIRKVFISEGQAVPGGTPLFELEAEA